jgi:serine/threonine protein kinase
VAESRPALLPELLTDQRRRWQAGDPVAVEFYLREHPDFATDTDAMLDLIANEIALRGEHQVTAAPEEYAARFPALTERLNALFELKSFLTNATRETDAFTLSVEPVPVRRGRPGPGSLPRVPGYEILQYLDGGGQGDVWKARHLLLGREVALKVLHERAEVDETQLARFVREGRLTARLDHPHIIRIHECAEAAGRYFLSMEFAPHGTLKDRLATLGRPPWKVSAALVAPLARAVQHLHDWGIVHRDLKPSNVLFGEKGVPKVADFGLAKCLDEDTLRLTPTHAVLGTANYMAPEQAAGRNRDIGPVTDVYALGAVLYECLTGRPPFVGDTWLETINLVQHRPVSPPSLGCPDLPPTLERICLQCLEKSPAERYPSAAALADDLERFLDGRPTTVDAGDDPATDDGPADRHSPAAGANFPVIPGYVILEILGRGSMGAVYKARQLSLRRIVALKTIHGQNVAAARWRRLRREARLMASLNHANIVQVFDMGEYGDMVYIAFELITGGSLDDVIRRDGTPAPREAAELVEAVAGGAGLMHRLRLVHRDLKPANILFVPPDPDAMARLDRTSTKRYGTPKITDFGLSKRVGTPDDDFGDADEDAPTSEFATVAGTLVGTPAYMSPEQWRGEQATTAADVWALGVILYELLAGRRPYSGEGIVDIAASILSREPPPPERAGATLPARLKAICSRCLQKDPTRRYANGTELARDLQEFLADSPDTASAAPGFWERLKFWRKT